MKEKIQYLLQLVACLQVTCLFGQLSNGSFEENNVLPSGLGQYYRCEGWGNANSATAKPDYFHYAGVSSCDLPETPMAIVNAYQGNAVMGMLLCGRPGTNQRVYLSYDLNSPMLVGQRYSVSFRVTNGSKTSVSNAGLGVDQLGVALTQNPLSQIDFNPINVNPDFVVNEVLYSSEWKYFTFFITPTVECNYLTVGVFGDDSDKQIEIREGVDPSYAYAFFDDFRIFKVPSNYQPLEEVPDRNDHNEDTKPELESNSNDPWFIPNSFTPSSNDMINDVFKPVANRVDQWEFSVFNLWGERMFVTSDISLGWDGTFAGIACENGSYIWRVVYNDPLEDDPKAKLIKQGTFTLLR